MHTPLQAIPPQRGHHTSQGRASVRKSLVQRGVDPQTALMSDGLVVGFGAGRRRWSLVLFPQLPSGTPFWCSIERRRR